jgi:hypothetical protein
MDTAYITGTDRSSIADLEAVRNAAKMSGVLLSVNPIVWEAMLAELKRLREALRQKQSVTVPAELIQELWATVKTLRDEVACLRSREDDLNALLDRMKAAGMSAHLPTLEEVQAAWRGEQGATGEKFPDFDAGFEARQEGEPVTDNPHPPGSKEAVEWAEGWEDLDEHLKAREAAFPGWSNV